MSIASGEFFEETVSEGLEFGFGVAATWVALRFAMWLFSALTVAVEDEHVAVVTRFGRLVATLKQPGLHWVIDRWLPWVKVRQVSLARDFRLVGPLHVNDARGTTVVVDVWFELRIVDAAKALFAVEDWDSATRKLVMHAATAALSARDFAEILRDRNELGALLQRELSAETERWGVRVEQVFLRDVSLLPDVSRHLFGAVAARLERARAVIEELGRLDVARLEAETAQKAATLVADAKGQYPLAIGRALSQLKRSPEVLKAYMQLYAWSQLRPHRTVAFEGFSDQGLRAADAAMLAPELTAGSSGAAPPTR